MQYDYKLEGLPKAKFGKNYKLLNSTAPNTPYGTLQCPPPPPPPNPSPRCAVKFCSIFMLL